MASSTARCNGTDGAGAPACRDATRTNTPRAASVSAPNATITSLSVAARIALWKRISGSANRMASCPAASDGGPGNVTEVTNYYSYLQAFNFSYLGFSSAITVALLAATIALSWLIVRLVGWGGR